MLVFAFSGEDLANNSGQGDGPASATAAAMIAGDVMRDFVGDLGCFIGVSGGEMDPFDAGSLDSDERV